MKNLKLKVSLAVLLIITTLMMINSSFAASVADPKVKLTIVDNDKKVAKDIIKLIAKNEKQVEFAGFSETKLKDHLKGIAYAEDYKAYVALFEYKDSNDQGWSFSVVYDSETDTLVDAVKTDIGSAGMELRTAYF